MSSQQQQLNAMIELVDKMSPRLKRAFLVAIGQVRTQVQMRTLAEALSRRSLTEAIAAVNVESLEGFLTGTTLAPGETSFNDLLLSGITGGAAATLNTFPKSISLNMSFDLLNPNTVRFIESYRVPLIRELTKATRDGVLEVIQRGMLTGKAPSRQAKEIRQLIGLTKAQSKAVGNLRAQLETREILGFTRPDKRRLSAIERRIVSRHMRDGGLTTKQINGVVDRYYQSLVNRRALNIGRTEAVRSSNFGQLETWRQAKRNRLLSRNARKKWIVTQDDRLRPSHREIPSMNRGGRRIEESFQTPEGFIQAPPLGTNCRCSMVLSAF